jgi:hypothetical protein
MPGIHCNPHVGSGAVDEGTVQDQEQRDEKSITIVTGFLLGAAVLVLGLLLFGSRTKSSASTKTSLAR